MKPFIYLFFILGLVYSCKPPKPPLQPPGVKSDVPNLFPTEKDYPKEFLISGEYTLTKGKESLQFNSENEDLYCYYSLIADSRHPDEDIIPLRFRLYDQNNKLLRVGLPKVQRSFVEEKGFTEEVTVSTYIPYHKDGVKIKAVLVDDTGKDMKVLAERGILTPEEFRKRPFYQDCHREAGFHR
ncbi:MAG: hypothetical protein OXJ52_00160 [Oligoflexia bacterium]|nr:hypothetical protein [Oligoflexia bacterium]